MAEIITCTGTDGSVSIRAYDQDNVTAAWVSIGTDGGLVVDALDQDLAPISPELAAEIVRRHPATADLRRQVDQARSIAVRLEQELAAALPERVAQGLALLRDRNDPDLWFIEEIEYVSRGVRSPDADEVHDALVTLAACALHLLAVSRG